MPKPKHKRMRPRGTVHGSERVVSNADALANEGLDGVTQLAVRIPTRLYRRVKIRSIATGDSMSKITEDAYRQLLQQQ